MRSPWVCGDSPEQFLIAFLPYLADSRKHFPNVSPSVAGSVWPKGSKPANAQWRTFHPQGFSAAPAWPRSQRG